jgi:hypothetical protein
LRIFRLLLQLEQFCTAGNVNDETIVVDFLKTTTMVGLLPGTRFETYSTFSGFEQLIY